MGGFPSTLQWASRGNPHHTQWEVGRTEGQGRGREQWNGSPPPMTPPPLQAPEGPLVSTFTSVGGHLRISNSRSGSPLLIGVCRGRLE